MVWFMLVPFSQHSCGSFQDQLADQSMARATVEVLDHHELIDDFFYLKHLMELSLTIFLENCLLYNVHTSLTNYETRDN